MTSLNLIPKHINVFKIFTMSLKYKYTELVVRFKEEALLETSTTGTWTVRWTARGMPPLVVWVPSRKRGHCNLNMQYK